MAQETSLLLLKPDCVDKGLNGEVLKRLEAEGFRAAAILKAEGDKQSAVLRAEGNRTARILKADWTQPDARIEQFLSDHGRSGVPFYLLYAPDGREIELPQILSPQIVAAALDSASGKES